MGLLDKVKNLFTEEVEVETEEKVVTPDFSNGNVEITSDKLMSKVTINKDDDLIPDNIKEGINIFGVDGTGVMTDISEYFETTITPQNMQNFGANSLIKKIPSITVLPTVTSLAYAFNGSPIKNVNLVGETSQVTVCNNMFSSCSKLEEVPLFDTSNVTNMSYMFYNTKIKTIPLYTTSKVTNMAHMCDSCNSLKTISNIDTSKVTNMESMFQYSSNIETLPELDASSLTNVSNMFMGTKSNFKNFGGLKDFGKAFSPDAAENRSNYTLILSTCANLTHESLMNIINGLYNIKAAGVATQRVVLGSTNLAKLNEEEKVIATNKGWSLS